MYKWRKCCHIVKSPIDDCSWKHDCRHNTFNKFNEIRTIAQHRFWASPYSTDAYEFVRACLRDLDARPDCKELMKFSFYLRHSGKIEENKQIFVEYISRFETHEEIDEDSDADPDPDLSEFYELFDEYETEKIETGPRIRLILTEIDSVSTRVNDNDDGTPNEEVPRHLEYIGLAHH